MKALIIFCKIFFLGPIWLTWKVMCLCCRWTLYIFTGGLLGIFDAAFKK